MRKPVSEERTRSPMWALWRKMLIRCQSGVPYLFRLRIVQTPWFGIYLHDIYEPDDGPPHNHPWSFVSIVLRGHYVERVYIDALDWPKLCVPKRHRRFSAHRMGRHEAHKIIEAAPGLKTLILVGKRGPGWGFFEDGEYVPWQEYEARRPERAAA
jgi:hypothetical protein